MDKSENNARHRLIRIYQMLMEDSDIEHPMIITNILPRLRQEYGIETTRDTVRDDLKAMCDCGLPIEMKLSTQHQFYYDGHVFETAELKLLIDAVTSSKFITERESRRLIQKILSLTSRQEAENLHRHIYVEGRIKTDNESGYYIVDAVNEAIETGHKISFRYMDYDAEKNRVLRHNGKIYIFSPYVLIWDGDYYYMLGWYDTASDHNKTATKSDDASASDITANGLTATASPKSSASESKHQPSIPQGDLRTFRLDRVAEQPRILEEMAVPVPDDFDINAYLKSTFRMYGSDQTVEVSLLCENRIMPAIIDQFGKDVQTDVVDKEHFRARLVVCPSPTFYRWLFGWGCTGEIVVEGPEIVIRQYERMLKNALRKQI